MRKLFVVRLLTLVAIAACSHPEDAAPFSDGLDAGIDRGSAPMSVTGEKSQTLFADSDGDSIADADDNCPLIANASQTNSNGGGPGDACRLTFHWSPALLGDFARFRSHKELVVTFAPVTLTGCPDLLRVSAPAPALAIPHLSPVTQRLGVQSRLELLPGQVDTISGDEVLAFRIGEDEVLGGAKAHEVWLRVEGNATISVKFFAGNVSLGVKTAANQGTQWKGFFLDGRALFDRVELRAVSGKFSLRGPGEGVSFSLARSLTDRLSGRISACGPELRRHRRVRWLAACVRPADVVHEHAGLLHVWGVPRRLSGNRQYLMRRRR